jgi:anti-sigma-K factor RskA
MNRHRRSADWRCSVVIVAVAVVAPVAAATPATQVSGTKLTFTVAKDGFDARRVLLTVGSWTRA